MRNNMKELVGRKVKYIDDNEFMWFGRKESYEIEHQDSTHFYLIDDNGIRNAIENNCLDTHFELLINEPQFKQGDKVLVSNNKSYWAEGEFITEYKDEFIVKTNVDIISRKHIKPYEDEIKVGDWVKSELNNCIFKYQTGRLVDDLTKITNQDLIDKLNEL